MDSKGAEPYIHTYAFLPQTPSPLSRALPQNYLLSLIVNILLLLKKKNKLLSPTSLQEKNPTNVRGKDAHGNLLGLMNSQDISENTLESNLSSVQTVTAASPAPTTLLCTGSATCSCEHLRRPPQRGPPPSSSLSILLPIS